MIYYLLLQIILYNKLCDIEDLVNQDIALSITEMEQNTYVRILSYIHKGKTLPPTFLFADSDKYWELYSINHNQIMQHQGDFTDKTTMYAALIDMIKNIYLHNDQQNHK